MHYSCPTAALPGEEDTIVPSPSCPNFLAIAIAYGPALLMSYSTAALPGEEDTIVPSPSCPNFLAIAIAYGHALLMSYCCFAGRGRHHCPQPFLSQSSGYCNCLWTGITHVLLYCCLLLLRRARKTPLSPALLVPIFWLLQLLMDMHYSCPTAALPGEEDTIVPSPSCPNFLAIAIAYGPALLMSSSTAALPARKTPLSPALLVPIFWLMRLPMDLHYSCPTAALPGEEDTIVPSPSCPNLLAIAIAYGPALLMSYCCFAGRGRHHCPQPFLSQFSGDCNCLWTCITHVLLLLCRARKTPLTPALLVPIFWLLQLPMDMHYSCPTAALPGEEDTIVPSPSCPNFLAIAIAYGPALLMSYSTAALPGEEDTIVPSPSCPNLLAIAIAYGPALLMSYCCFAGRGRHHCPQPFLSQSSGYCNCLWTGITHVLLYCCFAGRGRHHCPQPFLSQSSGYCDCLWTCITHVLLLLCRARKTPLSPALLVPIFWRLQLPMDLHYSCPTAALPGKEDTIDPSPSCPNLLAIAIAYGQALLMSYSTAACCCFAGRGRHHCPQPFLSQSSGYCNCLWTCITHVLLLLCRARKTPLSPALLVPIFWRLQLPMDLHYSCLLLLLLCRRGRHHCPQPFLSQSSGYCDCLWTCITHVLLLLCRARKTPLSPALLVPIFWLLRLPMDLHYSCPTAALPGEEDTIVPSPSCPNFLAIAIAYGPALLMSYCCFAGQGRHH